jgi:hypothetical protein
MSPPIQPESYESLAHTVSQLREALHGAAREAVQVCEQGVNLDIRAVDTKVLQEKQYIGTTVGQSETSRSQTIEAADHQAVTAISAAGLNPEQKQLAEHKWAVKQQTIRQANAGATHTVQQKAQACRHVISEKQNSHRAVLYNKLATAKTRLAGSNLDTLSASQIHSRIMHDAPELSRLLQVKGSEVEQLIATKRKELLDLISAKDARVTEVSNQCLNELRQYIASLKTSQTRAGSSGQSQGNWWEQQGPQGSRTGNTGSGSSSGDQEQRQQQTQTQSSRDEKIKTMMGKEHNADPKPYSVVLTNITHQRRNGKTDDEIYRLLLRQFHPDVSKRDDAEAVSRVLTGCYDKQSKSFIV